MGNMIRGEMWHLHVSLNGGYLISLYQEEQAGIRQWACAR